MGFTIDQLLVFAARAGNFDLAEERLARGADPNYCDPDGVSAAMEAARQGDRRVMSLLLAKSPSPFGPAAAVTAD
jgi:ankyrin repeat protein